MRYRGKCTVTFYDDATRTIERVADADNVDTANKICAIEFHGSYKQWLGDRVKKYDIEPCAIDNTPRPTADFVEERLRIVNDLHKPEIDRRRAKEEIYKAFYAYQPSYDDDSLSDTLSYCDEGICESYWGKLDKLAKNLVEELDGLWYCHYKPHENNLEEQYLKAIS